MLRITMRADALATLYVFHPLQSLSSGQRRIPILMYHSVSNRKETTHAYYQTVTSPEAFGSQMKYLHENGYTTMSPGEAVRHMRAPGVSSVRPVVITFDDGFADFYTNAFPIMNRYGFVATVYLPTAYIGKTVKDFKGTACLTWDQVRELHHSGVEFGSHTVTHPQLKFVEPAEVEYEIRSSKEAIEQELSYPVTSFAYPYAFPETDRTFTRQLRESLQKDGYENGVSTVVGRSDHTDNPFFMRRLPINGADDERLFEAKLSGGYDWLRTVQYAAKYMKTLINRR